MISESIEKGTRVWNRNHGFGEFQRWFRFKFNVGVKRIAIVQFENERGMCGINRKELNEIE